MSEFNSESWKSLLDELNQSHVYQNTGCLNDKNHHILQQLSKISLKDSIKHFTSAHDSLSKEDLEFKPASKVIDSNNLESSEKDGLYKKGLQALQEGKVASVILSGGQGTRLGFNGPKGMYDLGLISHKTIFQIHIERIQRVRLLCQQSSGKLPSIPIYVMTSDLNHQIIKDFFHSQNYFSYPSEDIVFFEQGLEPCFTFDGKIIIDNPNALAMAPDGNGGIYNALNRSGSLRDMVKRGVEHLHIYGIDNILTKSLDPLFLGICIENNVECGNKVVWRAGKSEKVGVTAEANGKMHILEYSEIPPQLAEVEDNHGKLLFGAANICNHYLKVSFLLDVVVPNMSSVYHIAKKKIPFFDFEQNKSISPSQPNGIKLESFIFDVFPMADRWVVVESYREDEFAPVKNEPGNPSDSPDTARAMLSNQAKKWLKAVGANLINEDAGICEISPLLSYQGEGLERFAGQDIVIPCYLI